MPLNLAPPSPDPALTRSLMGVAAASEMGHQHPSKSPLPARGTDHRDTRKDQGKEWKGVQDSLWGAFVVLPCSPGPVKPTWEAAVGGGNAFLQQNHQPPALSSCPAGALVLPKKDFSSLSPPPLISWQPDVPCSDKSAKFGFPVDKQSVPSSIFSSKAWRAGWSRQCMDKQGQGCGWGGFWGIKDLSLAQWAVWECSTMTTVGAWCGMSPKEGLSEMWAAPNTLGQNHSSLSLSHHSWNYCPGFGFS